MKKLPYACWAVALAAMGAAIAGCATDGAGSSTPVASSAEIDALTRKITQESFRDKGIVKTAAVFAADQTLQACDTADVSGKPMDAELMKRLEEANMKTIRWPADGRYLGDWKKGEAAAQSGRGMTWTDQAGVANGGNCYNCHQIDKKEISFGTIGPSLYNYGKIRGVTDPNSPQAQAMVKYTWGKIWNAKAYNACSNMPRFGHKAILSEDQVRDIVALLLDPKSPVNQ